MTKLRTKTRLVRRAKRRKSAPEIPVVSVGDAVIDGVPVINQSQSVPAWVAVGTAIGNVVVLLANQFGAPLDQAGMLTLLTALNIMATLGIWGYNRWLGKEVTITSLDPQEKKAMRRLS
jgi:hypothetical protein